MSDTLVKVTYDERCSVYGRKPGRLAPNNAIGRAGAVLYNKTGQGFGIAFPGAMISSGVVPGLVASVASGALVWTILLSIVMLTIVALNGPTLYARALAKPHRFADEIDRVRNTYRTLDKHGKSMTKSLVDNMEKAIREGREQSIMPRVEKFDKMHKVLVKSAEIAEDTSDLEAADVYLDGMKQLEKSMAKQLTR